MAEKSEIKNLKKWSVCVRVCAYVCLITLKQI